MSDDVSLARARALLVAQGVDATVDCAGHAHDVLVVHAPPDRLEAVRACAPRLRALGFRYVTIEIAPDA